MLFVLDASVALSWCFVDEASSEGRVVLKFLLDNDAEVPAIWPLEIANVLAVSERKGRITPAQSDEFLTTLANLNIRVESHIASPDARELFPLIRRYGLSAYDAAYLELAKRRGLQLATFDRQLIAAAPQEGVRLFNFQSFAN